MFRLQTVDPQEATGPVAEAYNIFPPQIGVPTPFQMISASPALASLQAGFVKHFMAHQNLSFKLQALIRYLSAADQGFSFCVGLNGNMLKFTGLSDVDLEAIHEDPGQAPLDEREKALLLLTRKALRTPEVLSDADFDQVRAHGYSDADIMDALWLGAGMQGMASLFKALVKA
jgi:alkylhydroperoxidase family enzyme